MYNQQLWSSSEGLPPKSSRPLSSPLSGARSCEINEINYDELELKTKLDETSSGEVWAAIYHGSKVAVKFHGLPGDLAVDKKESMLREAAIMKDLCSEYLVGLRGICLNPRYGLVMEYCEGGTLQDRLEKTSQTITLQQMILWAMEVCNALRILHDLNILHRDLKGENVFLGSHDEAKVGDFDLSLKLRSPSESKKGVNGGLVGTPRWLAPELFYDKRYSTATDVYSLGMILWHILTRKIPFEKVKPYMLEYVKLQAIQEDLPENCPPLFQEMILACWNPDPNRRPAAGQVGDRFKAAWKSIESISPPVSTNPEELSENDEQEVSRYRKAADQGDASAQYNLGFCYANGAGVDKDDKEAVRWYRKAADQGNADAQTNLGFCYETGAGVDKDEKQAASWYQKAADQGNASAQYNLGWCYANGTGVDKDDKEAVRWYRKAADQGDASAQYNLGGCYENGTGVIKDEKQAVNWYRKAADQGDADAQYNLGVCYAIGTGVIKDEEQAVSWYQKAADQGDARAQYNLGWRYANGKGVVEDDNQAVSWYQKAADQGDARAQYNLGSCYENGRGIVKDKQQAVIWYQKAAEQGDVRAQYNLGWCYANGTGVIKDDKEAVKWYLEAAKQGDAGAQYNLGWCYTNGVGVAKNDKEAERWYQKGNKSCLTPPRELGISVPLSQNLTSTFGGSGRHQPPPTATKTERFNFI